MEDLVMDAGIIKRNWKILFQMCYKNAFICTC